MIWSYGTSLTRVLEQLPQIRLETDATGQSNRTDGDWVPGVLGNALSLTILEAFGRA